MILIHADCMDALRDLPDNSVDSVVTDPPYGFGDGKRAGFMGKAWDRDVPSSAVWAECLRVLKPGGHLLAFAGTRTQHRMAVAIEDAGFEIRDMIAWVYGSGFPKSLDVSKAIDKAAGARGHDSTRFNAIGQQGERTTGGDKFRSDHPEYVRPKGITPAAQQWQGWGTALKPALEPITVARKPFQTTVAANVLEHGTGALNVDGCRVESGGEHMRGEIKSRNTGGWSESKGMHTPGRGFVATDHPGGRWPANLIHDGSDEVVGLFPKTTTGGQIKKSPRDPSAVYGLGLLEKLPHAYPGDSGSAARFFYCAKASKKDRDEGLGESEIMARRMFASGGRTIKDGQWVETNSEPQPRRNHHPTVKPTDLMRYLCRLVTPPGGTVLDPFMGSGSTGKAAKLEGFGFIGIEKEAEYIEIARARIGAAVPEVQQQALAV